MSYIVNNLDVTLATAGLIGAGVGIGVVFGSLILGVTRNPTLIGQCNIIVIWYKVKEWILEFFYFISKTVLISKVKKLRESKLNFIILALCLFLSYFFTVIGKNYINFSYIPKIMFNTQ